MKSKRREIEQTSQHQVERTNSSTASGHATHYHQSARNKPTGPLEKGTPKKKESKEKRTSHQNSKPHKEHETPQTSLSSSNQPQFLSPRSAAYLSFSLSPLPPPVRISLTLEILSTALSSTPNRSLLSLSLFSSVATRSSSLLLALRSSATISLALWNKLALRSSSSAVTCCSCSSALILRRRSFANSEAGDALVGKISGGGDGGTLLLSAVVGNRNALMRFAGDGDLGPGSGGAKDGEIGGRRSRNSDS